MWLERTPQSPWIEFIFFPTTAVATTTISLAWKCLPHRSPITSIFGAICHIKLNEMGPDSQCMPRICSTDQSSQTWWLGSKRLDAPADAKQTGCLPRVSNSRHWSIDRLIFYNPGGLPCGSPPVCKLAAARARIPRSVGSDIGTKKRNRRIFHEALCWDVGYAIPDIPVLWLGRNQDPVLYRVFIFISQRARWMHQGGVVVCVCTSKPTELELSPIQIVLVCAPEQSVWSLFLCLFHFPRIPFHWCRSF